MQAFKALPLMRPSRSSSPAPPVTTTANGDSHPVTLNGTAFGNALPKVSRSASGPPRSRSIARPLGGLSLAKEGALTPHHTGPAGLPAHHGVAPGISVNGVPNGFKTGTSPPGTRSSTPAMPPSASMGNLGVDNSTAAGGVIDAIGLRLSEQVNKTCFGVDLKTRKGFKKGTGWTLGEAVVKELPAPTADAYLLRAVLRTSVRSLTIYTSRLEYFLLPAITDPSFLLPMQLQQTVITTAANAAPLLNPLQMFALTVCHAAWETCEVLEVALETQTYPRFVAELLRPIMDKLDSIVARVVTPLLASLKKELVLSLDFSQTAVASPPINGHKLLPIAPGPTTTTILPSTIPSKAACHIPVCMRAFAAKVDGARRAFEVICKDCREDGESWIASVVVAIAWRGIVSCSDKTDIQDSSKIFAPSAANHGRPPSPESVARAMVSLANDGTLSGTVHHAQTAIVGGAVVKMASILPSRAASRPASPPKKAAELPVIPGAQGIAIPPAALILASFEALLTRLVSGLVQKPAAIPPSANDPTVTEHLAREALAEALEAVTSMKIVVTALERPPTYMHNVLQHLKDDVDMETEQDEQVVDAAEDVPAILLFYLIAKKVNKSIGQLATASASTGARNVALLRSPAQVWGIAEEEYDRQVLSAFSVAEDRARRVALVYKSELERVAKDLAAFLSTTTRSAPGHSASSSPTLSDLQREAAKTWVKTMNLALVARCGVGCVFPF
ncbi:hypothetical protein QFC19_007332 [Naganishia cerealis]|uniref:Uncharacterized protein n=1 Tax=Naganishia cerealis TaxID=610337 RepID=A0ACC2VB83_9TREE|nr:hypothetical protein QFC19_007332 [Naganishia cerealis]